LISLGVRPLGGYNYITPRCAGLSAPAGLSCNLRVERFALGVRYNYDVAVHPSVSPSNQSINQSINSLITEMSKRTSTCKTNTK